MFPKESFASTLVEECICDIDGRSGLDLVQMAHCLLKSAWNNSGKVAIL